MVCFYRLNARGFDDIDLAVFYRVALSDFGGAFCMGVRSSGAFNDFFFFSSLILFSDIGHRWCSMAWRQRIPKQPLW